MSSATTPGTFDAFYPSRARRCRLSTSDAPRIRPITTGSSMLAITLSFPPQRAQVSVDGEQPWHVVVSIEFDCDDRALEFERYLAAGATF
jgi:hypothetical protein